MVYRWFNRWTCNTCNSHNCIVIFSKVCYKEPRQTNNLETLGEESIPYYTEPSLKGEYGQLDREDCDELYMDNSNHDATQTVPSLE